MWNYTQINLQTQPEHRCNSMHTQTNIKPFQEMYLRYCLVYDKSNTRSRSMSDQKVGTSRLSCFFFCLFFPFLKLVSSGHWPVYLLFFLQRDIDCPCSKEKAFWSLAYLLFSFLTKGHCPCSKEKARKARTCWYREHFHLIYQYQTFFFFLKDRTEMIKNIIDRAPPPPPYQQPLLK